MMSLSNSGGLLSTQPPQSLHFTNNYLDLAIIGNSVFSCAIDKTSKVVWSCFPRLDGDPIFNCLMNNNSEFSVNFPNKFNLIIGIL